jgi:hypothetical protein
MCEKVYLHNWMSGLDHNRKLVELCLPGSHDAGVYLDKDKGVTPGDKARCQDGNIGKQAYCGSRVFDIRCFMDGKTPKMGHFFADKPGVGDWGGTLESALSDAADFLIAFNTEFHIFRIGHTKCVEAVSAVLEAFRAKTNQTTFKSYATLIHRGVKGSLADVQVRHLRGKLVLLCDNAELKSANFKPGDGYYLYDKYPSTSAAQISFCGKYSGDLKTATKLFKKDRGNWSPEGAATIAEEACNGHRGHPPNHLFWVYWQETGGNVLENAMASTGIHNRLENFLSKFRVTDPTNPNYLPLPNVIGHDFVDKFTCGAIVKMNKDVNTKLAKYEF